jgi:two-component system, sensor histidine kinase YesM
MKNLYKKLRPMHHSIVFKLVMLVLAIFLPLISVLIFTSSYSMKTAKEQIYNQNRNVLKLYMNQLQQSLDQLDFYYHSLGVNNYDYAVVNRNRKDTVKDNYQYELSKLALLNKMTEENKENPLFDSLFLYFGNQDLFITGSNNSQYSNKEVSSYIRKTVQLKAAQGNSYAFNWQTAKIGDSYYLIRIIESLNVYSGAWINLDSCIKQYGLYNIGDSTKFFFSNADGTPLTSLYNFSEKISIDNNYMVDEKNKKNLVVFEKAKNGNFGMMELIPENNILSALPILNQFIKIFSFLSIAIIPLFLFILNKLVLNPLNKLSTAMRKIEGGDVEYRIEETKSSSEFERIYLKFNDMMDQIKALKFDVYDGKIERQKIKLRYLSQQIQPHFILNTLNIIYSYEPKEYNLIQKTILCLVKYFRYIVNVNSEFVGIAQELDHIRNYFEIQKIRYPECFSYAINCEAELLSAPIPPLIIQNFAENSIKYALVIGEKIEIKISAERYEDKYMKITVMDTGKGFSNEVLIALEELLRNNEKKVNLGVGIRNVVERLQIIYHSKASIRFYNSPNAGATVEMILPLELTE